MPTSDDTEGASSARTQSSAHQPISEATRFQCVSGGGNRLFSLLNTGVQSVNIHGHSINHRGRSRGRRKRIVSRPANPPRRRPSRSRSLPRLPRPRRRSRQRRFTSRIALKAILSDPRPVIPSRSVYFTRLVPKASLARTSSPTW